MELVEGTTLAAVCGQLLESRTSVAELDLAIWLKSLSKACEESREAERPLSAQEVDAVGCDKRTTASPTGTSALLASGSRDYIRHVVYLVRQVANAAHALHEAGIVHRDIKPDNILVGPDGSQAVLMDLGLAQLVDETEGRLTRTRQFVGTLRYASPEQVLAVDKVDRRSDVYSLGATLWELLTLRPLFGATEQTPPPELMRQIQYEEPGRLRKHHPGIPRDLEAIVEKCLQKDVRSRYASAHALAADLEAFLKGQPVQARPVGGLERGWKWAKRRPVIAALMAGLVMVTGGGGAGILWKYLEAEAQRMRAELLAENFRRQKDIADEQRRQAETAKREAERSLTQAEANLYFHRIALADREWRNANVSRARELLAECPQSLRRWEWRYLDRLCNSSACLVIKHPDDVGCVAFSPDGRTLATAAFDVISLWGISFGKDGRPDHEARLQTTLVGDMAALTDIGFDPSNTRLFSLSDNATLTVWETATGKRLHFHKDTVAAAFDAEKPLIAAMSVKGSVEILDANTGEATRTIAVKAAEMDTAAFAPDLRTLAFAERGQAHSVRVWSLDRGKELYSLGGHTSRVTRLTFSRDGSRLASSSAGWEADDVRLGNRSEIKLWDLETGREISTLRGHRSEITALAFADDGKRLASASWDKTVILWEADNGKELFTIRGIDGEVYDTTFSSDGNLLATSSRDGSVMVWDVTDALESRTLRGHASTVFCVNISPDGTRIASSSEDQTVRIWNAKTRREESVLRGHDSYVRGVAFSPDGRQVASAGWDGTVKVWDLNTGQVTRMFRGHEESPREQDSWVSCVAFHPRGDQLASAGIGPDVKIWDLRTGKLVRKYLVPHRIESIAFNLEGTQLAASGESSTIRIWDFDRDQVLPTATFSSNDKWVSSVRFNSDGKYLVSVASFAESGEIWDLVAKKHHSSLAGRYKTCAAFTPDNDRVVTGENGPVKIWDRDTGRELLSLMGHTWDVTCAVFSRDGGILVTSSGDHTIKIWEREPGR